MKKRSLILAAVFLLTAGISFREADAQEKSKKEMEKEMQEAIDARKKAMAEQKKAQEEVQKAVDEAMKSYRFIMEDTGRFNRAFRINEDFGRVRSYRIPDVPIVPGMNVFTHFNGDAERTSWEFSKNIRESGFSRDYTIDVEPTVKTVVMAINGDCKEGEIRIKIIMPNGKAYSDILLDEFGNLNWRKSFVISDTENKDKIGAWKFEINSSKATGYFRISLQTY